MYVYNDDNISELNFNVSHELIEESNNYDNANEDLQKNIDHNNDTNIEINDLIIFD